MIEVINYTQYFKYITNNNTNNTHINSNIQQKRLLFFESILTLFSANFQILLNRRMKINVLHNSKSKKKPLTTDSMKVTTKGIEILHKIIQDEVRNAKSYSQKNTTSIKPMSNIISDFQNCKFQISKLNFICRTILKHQAKEEDKNIKSRVKTNENNEKTNTPKRTHSNYIFWKKKFEEIDSAITKKITQQIQQKNKDLNTQMLKEDYKKSISQLVDEFNKNQQCYKKRNLTKIRQIYLKKFNRWSHSELYVKQNRQEVLLESQNQPILQIRSKNLSNNSKILMKKNCIR